MPRPLFLALALLPATAPAQWQLQQSNTTADLRGIHSLGNGIAWASGSHGTVLRTVDNGQTWQPCTVPPAAEALDFRGIQAFDATTAIVMSSGKGDLSRLYKTTDSCKTWKLLTTNPDPEGFWDAIKPYTKLSEHPHEAMLILGDSVQRHLKLWQWSDANNQGTLAPVNQGGTSALPEEGSFAASNSALQVATAPQTDKRWKYAFRWASETPQHAYISYVRYESNDTCDPCLEETDHIELPMASGTSTSGVFSIEFSTDVVGVAVGGNYAKPDASASTAATTTDGGMHWKLSTTPPHGYRSSVAYSPTTKSWITVGPNGTDLSTDDGRDWRALRPSPGEAPDADKNWNALSLPFVVGPHGRIGLLRPEALKP